MRPLIASMFIVAGAIHLLPLAGVPGPERLAALYGMSFADPNLAILMRHRAVLFGLLGSLMLAAAIKPAWQLLALVAGLASVTSFLWIAWTTGSYNAALATIVRADLLALICLLVAACCFALQSVRP